MLRRLRFSSACLHPSPERIAIAEYRPGNVRTGLCQDAFWRHTRRVGRGKGRVASLGCNEVQRKAFCRRLSGSRIVQGVGDPYKGAADSGRLGAISSCSQECGRMAALRPIRAMASARTDPTHEAISFARIVALMMPAKKRLVCSTELLKHYAKFG